VTELRQQFLVSGKVVVRERLVVIAPEPAADEMPVMNYRAKLSPHHLLSLCQWVDRQHSEGRTVTNSKAQNFIRITFEIEITQRSVQRYFKRLGLSWQRIKEKKRTLDGHRIDAIHDFLIRLDQHAVAMADTDDAIPVCTDESYLHNNHWSGMSCYANKELMGKSASKGHPQWPFVRARPGHESAVRQLDLEGRSAPSKSF
jgi:hypothetical protein